MIMCRKFLEIIFITQVMPFFRFYSLQKLYLMKEIKFCGYIITNGEKHPNPKKVADVRNLRPPNTKVQMIEPRDASQTIAHSIIPPLHPFHALLSTAQIWTLSAGTGNREAYALKNSWFFGEKKTLNGLWPTPPRAPVSRK